MALSDYSFVFFFLFFFLHINLRALFNAKAILQEKQQWYYLTHSWEDKGAHTFPKSICLKVNIIAQLEFELAYHDSSVQRFNHYTTRTLTPRLYLPQTSYMSRAPLTKPDNGTVEKQGKS